MSERHQEAVLELEDRLTNKRVLSYIAIFYFPPIAICIFLIIPFGVIDSEVVIYILFLNICFLPFAFSFWFLPYIEILVLRHYGCSYPQRWRFRKLMYCTTPSALMLIATIMMFIDAATHREKVTLWEVTFWPTGFQWMCVIILINCIVVVLLRTAMLRNKYSHPRCPMCKYDLHACSNKGCPECGWLRD